ncbi:GspMb/PilO family protein [Pseudoalteromonas sp. YIC-656]|uniref:GspMb/PilO family protein n=1 Tax=Pseudoalteromonas pernae TaxID=3118054 RepID=UPI003242B9D8
MNLDTSVFDLGGKAGVPPKQMKLLLLCIVLLCAKFVLLPVVEWQNELLEEIEFYQLQLRDKESIALATEELVQRRAVAQSEMKKFSKLYFEGDKTSVQIHLNEAISAKANELGLRVSSRNSRQLQTVDDITTFEYNISLRGTSEPLQEFLYWIETQEPKLLVRTVRFNSIARTPNADLVLRIHQLVELAP